MERYKIQLETILDDSLKGEKKTWTKEEVEEIAKENDLVLSEEYSFYLQHYGNDYINEGYCFVDSKESALGQKSYNIDSIFGLYDDVNSINKQAEAYNNIIPQHLFPIAEMPGGDLVCMDKVNGGISFWFHDMDGNNLFPMADSFQDFILRFDKCEEDIQGKNPKVTY